MTSLSGLRAWILTDGKAGDENQCLGVARCLALTIDRRHVPASGPFGWFAPWGPIDPRQRAAVPQGVLHGPLPDLVIASGRRSVPYLRACRKLGVPFTAFLKDPRTGSKTADFIWVPEHDPLRGPNVLATVTSPHLVSPERLSRARAAPDPRLAELTEPRAAVLLGGDSRHGRFSKADITRLVGHLHQLVANGCSLMITASRRTPPDLREAVRALSAEAGGFFWDGSGDNPYVAMLALAETIVVTSDSVNMVSEAVATGAPVLLAQIDGTPARHRRMYASLEKAGALAPFDGTRVALDYPPINATPVIAQALADAYIERQSRRDRR